MIIYLVDAPISLPLVIVVELLIEFKRFLSETGEAIHDISKFFEFCRKILIYRSICKALQSIVDNRYAKLILDANGNIFESFFRIKTSEGKLRLPNATEENMLKSALILGLIKKLSSGLADGNKHVRAKLGDFDNLDEEIDKKANEIIQGKMHNQKLWIWKDLLVPSMNWSEFNRFIIKIYEPKEEGSGTAEKRQHIAYRKIRIKELNSQHIKHLEKPSKESYKKGGMVKEIRSEGIIWTLSIFF